MKIITKLIFSNLFKGVGKILKWVIIGLITFGMLLAWPLHYLFTKIRGRRNDPYK